VLGLGLGIIHNRRKVDSALPVLSSVEVGNVAANKIVMTYSEALDESNTPATTDYSVTSRGANAATNIAVSGLIVTITLTTNVYYGDTVLLSYTAGANPIQDAVGNKAADLTSQAVVNNVLET